MTTEPSTQCPPCSEKTSWHILPPLVLIMVAALGLRLWNLGGNSIWYDEGYSVSFGNAIAAGENVFSVNRTCEPPFFSALVVLAGKIAGAAGLTRGFWPFDACLKLVSLLSSTLAVFLAWAAFRKMFRNETAALLGALLAAVSPFQIYYAQELRSYGLYVFLSTALLYCSIRAIEENRGVWWAGVSLSMILLLYTHFFSVWNVALMNACFVCVWAVRRDRFLPWIISQTTAFILSLPALWLLYQCNKLYESVQNIYTIRPEFKQGFITFKTFLAGYSPNAGLYWTIFCLGGIFFLLGLWSLRKRPAMAGMAVLFSVVPMFANIIIWRMRHFPMYEHRLFIFSGIVACGVMGLGIAALRPRPLKWAAVTAVLILMAPALSDYYAQRLHPAAEHRMGVRYKPDNRGAAQFISQNMQPNDFVVHASHFTFFPLVHYLQGRGLDQCNLRMTNGELDGFLGTLPNYEIWNYYGAIPKMLPEVAARHRRLWYVESWWEPLEIPPHVKDMRQWLDTHAKRLDHRQLDGVSVTLYEIKTEGENL